MTTLPALYPKQTAVQIRKLLRAAFPATKFQVTTARGSMVSSVDVRWTDGPTVARVGAIVRCFESGSFNGMTDSFEYDRSSFLEIDGVIYRPGTKYVHTSRSLSPAFTARLVAVVAKYYGLEAPAIDARFGHVVATPEQDRDANRKGGDYWGTLVYRAASDRSAFLIREG